MTNFQGLGKHVGGAAGVINDAVGFEQGGNHHYPFCSGVDDALEIVDINSADAENRQANIDMCLLDLAQTNRLVIGFGWGGENRAEADVIGAVALRGPGLVKTVGGFADDDLAACLLSSDGDRVVILTHVNAFDRNLRCDFGMVVHDQRGAGLNRDFVKRGRKIDKLVDRVSFSAKLNEIDTTVDHLFSDSTAIAAVDVTKINYAVETTIE
jgi:hypothetical protein